MCTERRGLGGGERGVGEGININNAQCFFSLVCVVFLVERKSVGGEGDHRT